MDISKESQEDIERALSKFKSKQSALLPILHIIQKEKGYISTEAEEYVANLLDIPPARVHGVVTFYTMYNKNPVGKYLIQVCTNISCSLLGGGHLLDYILNKLGISLGETTEDGKFTVINVECLGSCGTAPVMQINDRYYENLNESEIDKILESLA
jgi:NADH-quinone oxidoreductase subunit E